MSIDADLRAGVIDESTVKERRGDLEKRVNYLVLLMVQ